MTNKSFLKFCIKQLLRNKAKVFKIFPSLIISLILFSSVIILKKNIENEINNNSKIFLGGDLEMSSKNIPLDNDNLQNLQKNFFVSEVIEFTSILRSKREQNQTIRVKMVDQYYPLVGKVKTEPPNALEKIFQESNTILINKTIQNNLKIKIGQFIKIQNTSFQIVGIIESLPDIGGFFFFGDYALIHKSNLENLNVDNLGSFIEYQYKILNKGKKKIDKEYFETFKNFKKKYPSDLSQNLNKNIENFIYFLSLISASALLISGIGLKNAYYSFLASNQQEIAIFKSLGLTSKNIKNLYFIQSIIFLFGCSFLAYLLSMIGVSILEPNVLENLNIKFEISFYLEDFIVLLGFASLTFLIFGEPVLQIIDNVKVIDLFRNSRTPINLKYSKKVFLKISALLVIFILCFCILNVKPVQSSLFFLFFIFVGIFYYYFSKIQIYVIKKKLNIKNIYTKIAAKNIHKFNNLNSIVTTTMGLGVTLLLFLGFLANNINEELNRTLQRNAPDFFFIGIPYNQVSIFSKLIKTSNNYSSQRIVPLISGSIEKINNQDPGILINKTNDSSWFINGERRISWTEKIPFNNEITKGRWWKKDDSTNLMISLDQKVANDLGLKIGDTMSLNIYGKTVVGTILNFRKVDYKDLNINFAILLNPAFASKFPHEFMSTVKFKDKTKFNLSLLIEQLPSVTYIDVSEYVMKTKNFLNKLFILGISISSIVIIIGLFVISNALNVVGQLKVYQNLVFRILGLNNLNLLTVLMIELIAIFVPIILFALMFSSVLSYIFVSFIFKITWYFSLKTFLLISIFFFIVLLLTFLIYNHKYSKFNIYHLIRNE